MKNLFEKLSFKKMMEVLNRSIYVGERYKVNMNAMAFASYVIGLLGLVLMIANIIRFDLYMFIASVATLVASVACAFCIKVLKNREIAILIPTIFCGIAFTVYTFTGLGEGVALLWSLLMPIGMCYFVSVKYGMILSAYYSILFSVVFYSPLRENLSLYYTDSFMRRFPVIYISLSIFTDLAMYQYHKNALLEIDYSERLNEEVRKQTAVAKERSMKIEEMSFQTIRTLADAIDAKDPYTNGHSTRVSFYSVLLAENLGWGKDRLRELRYAALVHDIGKIGIPDSILCKPGKLSDVEYDIIKSHTTMGYEILRGRTQVKMAEDVALSHHERYDGSGYPRGLKGNEISEEARIVAIADAFDAMNSNRVYRKACDLEHIRSELVRGKGKQFDPEYIEAFIELFDTGMLKYDSATDRDNKDQTMVQQSLLLRKAMEAFVSEDKEGALDVDYNEFSRLYDYISNIKKRFLHPFELILIELNTDDKQDFDEQEMERALKSMEQAINQSLRSVDILTRYGMHFLVILVGTASEDVEPAVGRIFREYYKISGGSNFVPGYKILQSLHI